MQDFKPTKKQILSNIESNLLFLKTKNDSRWQTFLRAYVAIVAAGKPIKALIALDAEVQVAAETNT